MFYCVEILSVLGVEIFLRGNCIYLTKAADKDQLEEMVEYFFNQGKSSGAISIYYA